MTVKLFAPARAGLAIPMPDRDNRLMPEEDGVAVDLGKPYYRRLFDDGDIVEVKPRNRAPAKKVGGETESEA